MVSNTILNRGREKVGGGGKEGMIDMRTRYLPLQSAKDADAGISCEEGIVETCSS